MNENLCRELEFADRIIRNALKLMTEEQKLAWASANARDGSIGDGTTRANERAAVLAGHRAGAHDGSTVVAYMTVPDDCDAEPVFTAAGSWLRMEPGRYPLVVRPAGDEAGA